MSADKDWKNTINLKFGMMFGGSDKYEGDDNHLLLKNHSASIEVIRLNDDDYHIILRKFEPKVRRDLNESNPLLLVSTIVQGWESNQGWKKDT